MWGGGRRQKHPAAAPLAQPRAACCHHPHCSCSCVFRRQPGAVAAGLPPANRLNRRTDGPHPGPHCWPCRRNSRGGSRSRSDAHISHPPRSAMPRSHSSGLTATATQEQACSAVAVPMTSNCDRCGAPALGTAAFRECMRGFSTPYPCTFAC